jgi:uncharacterized SAM-binding protein YcdF (DUF218 family)
MDIILSKFLPLLVYPLGLACLLILVGVCLAHRPRLKRVVLALALGVLWIGGNNWVAAALVRSLEWRYLPPQELAPPIEAPLAEVIVILGGGTSPEQYPRPWVEVNGAGDRVLYAAYLYHQGAAPNILLSGGRIEWLESGDSPAEDMAKILALMDVPPDALWLEKDSRNTFENATAAWELLAAKNIQRIILVTSAQHMPRSVALFEQQGFDVIPAPTDYTITAAEWQRLNRLDFPGTLVNLLPDAGSLADTTAALKEYLGMLYYWLRGQV